MSKREERTLSIAGKEILFSYIPKEERVDAMLFPPFGAVKEAALCVVCSELYDLKSNKEVEQCTTKMK